MRIFLFFVNAIYWLWIFIVPAGILGFISFWLYTKSAGNVAYAIVISVIGVVIGVLLAERVRKQYGLNNFFGRVSSTPDLDGYNNPPRGTDKPETK